MAEPKNWKKTLSLPKTEFPMRASLAKREPEILAQWKERDLYQELLAARAESPRFLLHDGPPYANGNLHQGHVLNKVLKDIAVKFHSMSGYRCEYIPGWDCHGLPIEHEVDKKLGKKKREMTQLEIREKCREYALRFVDIQSQEFQRLGVFGEWERPYTTLDTYYEAACIRELGRLIEKGLVYKDLKPVHWSYAAQTALAEAEVDFKPFTAPSIYVKFRFDEVPSLLSEAAEARPVFVVIWTTTPWTLPANLAVALHPDVDYLLVDVDGEALVLAEGLSQSVFDACNIQNATVLSRFVGHELVGRSDAPLKPLARHPFLDRDSVLLPADYVTLEQGTGAVHTAPGHGQEDHELGRHFGLEVLSPVDDYGRFTEGFETHQGLHVFKANPLIVEHLAAVGALLNNVGDEVRIERYPHCWRTKKPVIFRATPQWFVRVDDDGLRKDALEAIKATNWIPSWGEDRIRGMLEHRPDWCISRQRVWGVPIPALTCTKCGNVTLDHRVAFKLAEISEAEGCDAWFKRPVADFVPDGFTCGDCGQGADALQKEADILDVWFESGSSFAAVLESREKWEPVADLYLEGSDQHRGWFQSSLLIGVGARGHAPFKTVLTHGFVLDTQGHKYSKSSKNFQKPATIINSLGAEILRLWVSAVDFHTDMPFSKEILSRMSDAYRRIRNTARFLLGNLADFDPNRVTIESIGLNNLPKIDRWALDSLARLSDRFQKAYSRYEYHVVFHKLLEYCTVELSPQYLEVLKDRLYTEHPKDFRRRASQAVMYEILRSLALWAAPVLSFTAEEIWTHLPKRTSDPDSVHLALLPDVKAQLDGWTSPASRELFDQLFAVRGKVLSAIEALRPKSKGERKEGQIGSSQEAVVTLTVDGPLYDVLSGAQGDLAELFIVSQVRLERGPGDDNLPVVSITLSNGTKCPRCWNFRFDFGVDGSHAELCGRCAEVVMKLEAAVA